MVDWGWPCVPGSEVAIVIARIRVKQCFILVRFLYDGGGEEGRYTEREGEEEGEGARAEEKKIKRRRCSSAFFSLFHSFMLAPECTNASGVLSSLSVFPSNFLYLVCCVLLVLKRRNKLPRGTDRGVLRCCVCTRVQRER